MTQYWDIFGSDDFHSTYSDSDSRLSDHASYIENNATSQYENQVSDTVIVTAHSSNDFTVSVSGTDMVSRHGAANSSLNNNFNQYDSSSICMVFDYASHSRTGETGTNGGVNTFYGKVCMVNTNQTPTPFGDASFVACHEIGHCVGPSEQFPHHNVSYHTDPCNHDNVSKYISVGYKAGTFLHSPANAFQTCYGIDDTNVDYTVPAYSGCTENDMHK